MPNNERGIAYPMKIIRLSAIALFVSLLIIAGCDKNTVSTCVPIPNSLTYTVNAFDESSDSSDEYFNKNITNFMFTESATTYSGVGNCPNESCSIGLQIKNLTSKKITFKYAVGLIYNNGANTWSFDDSTSIDSMSSVNIGTLNNDCEIVTAPTTTVQLSKIVYK